MIAVHKSPNIPASLNNVAAPTSPDAISSDMYGAQDVKTALKNDQSRKCAYCERHFNGDYGAVEHYRPKKKYQVAEHTPLQDGYYWLAYDWDNLLFACSECNTSYKRCLFPLFDESKRDIAGKNISNEEPLLINPAKEDPAQFIVFREEMLLERSTDVTSYAYQKAKKTIEILKLNDRMDLLEQRIRVWKRYLDLKKSYDLLCTKTDTECIEARDRIGRCIDAMLEDSEEFVGMLKNQEIQH